MKMKHLISLWITWCAMLGQALRHRRELSTEFSTGLPTAIRARWVALLLSAWVMAGAQAQVSADIVALERKAVAGDPWAQLNLGAAYDNGLGGLVLDPVLAVQWYRRAAEAGLPEAQFNLAHCLATGSGVARDDAASLHWMLRAAEQGLASAQFLAGVMFAEGVGTEVDRRQAIIWLEKAAANGHLDALPLLQRLRTQDTDKTAQ